LTISTFLLFSSPVSTTRGAGSPAESSTVTIGSSPSWLTDSSGTWRTLRFCFTTMRTLTFMPGLIPSAPGSSTWTGKVTMPFDSTPLALT
jgi:hypothetical protein